MHSYSRRLLGLFLVQNGDFDFVSLGDFGYLRAIGTILAGITRCSAFLLPPFTRAVFGTKW